MLSFFRGRVNRKIPTTISDLGCATATAMVPAWACISRKVRCHVLSPRDRGCIRRDGGRAGAAVLGEVRQHLRLKHDGLRTEQAPSVSIARPAAVRAEVAAGVSERHRA
jgi:hypothetical protein